MLIIENRVEFAIEYESIFDKISWSFLSGIFLQLNCQGTFYNCQGNNYINLSWIVTFSLTIVKSSLTNVRTSLTVVKSSLTIVKIPLTLLLSGKKVSVALVRSLRLDVVFESRKLSRIFSRL